MAWNHGFNGLRDENWRWCAFGDLSVTELQAIHRARQEVFVVEQRCAYLDADPLDEKSFHLMAWTGDSSAVVSATTLAAYARVVLPGYKYAEPSLGRVLTCQQLRGLGLGHELLRRALLHCGQAFGNQPIRISAQIRLNSFYAQHGFELIGEPYLEDGIEHVEMWRPAVIEALKNRLEHGNR